jgi:transketolase
VSKLEEYKLDDRSKYLRRLIVEALDAGGRGHIGAAFSLVEILRVLYDDILTINPSNSKDPARDRLILSKGHGCLALYVMLYEKAFITKKDLLTFCHFNGLLGGHPEDRVPGIEASTGALGHGLAIGVGMALAAKIKKSAYHTFVVMGDGEINEGSVWESALSAAKHKLGNLVAIIDYNKLQSYASTSEVLELEPLAKKWQAFGFEVHESDGHNVSQLRKTFNSLQGIDKPQVVICHTVKGKGASFSEHNLAWHHKSKLKKEELKNLYTELS